MQLSLNVDIFLMNIGVRDTKIVQIIFFTFQYQPLKLQTLTVNARKQKSLMNNLETLSSLRKYGCKNLNVN